MSLEDVIDLEGYSLGHDDSTDSIEKGKLADVIVLDRSLFEIKPREISDARVVITLFEGGPVYRGLNATSAQAAD